MSKGQVIILLDFSSWNIQDNDGCLNIEATKVSWNNADRTRVRYIGKQINVTGDFQHRLIVCLQEGEVEDEKNRGFIRLWEIRNNWENRTWIYARKDGVGWTIHFEQLDQQNQVFTYHGTTSLQFNQRFNVEISRSINTYRLVVSNIEGKIVEESGEIEGVYQEYEYVWLASTIKSRRNNGNWSSGYIENLEIT